MQFTRRSFLKVTAASTVALADVPAILRAADAPPKAGSKYTLGLIGTGWWGTNILGAALGDGRVKLVGLCDVDQAELKRCSLREALSDPCAALPFSSPPYARPSR